MLDNLKREFNKTSTENGALAYKSTNSYVLDLFSQGGAYRERDDEEVISLFSKAFAEEPLLAMKTLFYLRDIRGGQGERRFFKLCLTHLSKHHPEVLRSNLHLVSEYGRWDDLWVLLETSLATDVIKLIRNQLNKDNRSENPSLIGKWLPSINTSSRKTRSYAKIIHKSLGLSEKSYRKMLSKLRSKINIVEKNITNKDYDKIEYDKIPSKAGMIYRDAFYRNDKENYMDFLEKLSNNDIKVNSSTLYPSDIIGKIMDNNPLGIMNSKFSENDIKLLEGQWRNLPNYIGENHEDSLVMADVSGSMMGTPINVAISLAMYIAERNKGIYENNFMTFSSNPELVEIAGSNIVEKARNISRANWDMSTNIEKAIEIILDTALLYDTPKNDMIKKLIIVSDMQFDRCVRGAEVHIFDDLKDRFNKHGYDFPVIVFWNVNSRLSNTPFTKDENGIVLVSGYSPSILTNILGSKEFNPYQLMLEVIESERYEDIKI